MTNSIGSFKLTCLVMNAACSVAKSQEDLDALLATKAGAVLIGSVTCEAREGNPEPQWFPGENEGFALNSFGMPNNGSEWYKSNLPGMVKRAHDAGKPLILSVAGFSLDEYVSLARLGEESGVDLIELNLGCPNTSDAGRPNPIFSFDVEMLEAVAKGVEEVLDHTLYSLKLSPYSNPSELARTAAVIAKTKAFAVVTSNTFPNGYWQDAYGNAVIGPNNGLAGTSGETMLPIALGQVRQFRDQLPKSIAVIGVGGISTPEHVKQYQNAGADFVQVATHIVRYGHSAINDVIA